MKLVNFKFQIYFSILLYTLYFILYTAPAAHAADFNLVSIRLDRLKANTTLSGLVCAIPSSPSAGTEAKISITFPSDFTIFSSTSNWTTNTSNLPSGAIAWPGIGATAQAVSSQTVTFVSSNLTASSKYCFNFSSSSSSTGSAGEKSGNISTKDSGNSVIDSKNYGMSIKSNDQVTVSATIPPDTHDLQNSLSLLTPGDQFQQQEVLEYKITYGVNSSSSTDMTLEAQWYQGTIEGQSNPSVNVVEYEIGTATTGYGSTAPVVDTVNNKITWNFSNFPAQTVGQTVRFKLRTNSNYKEANKVSFPVKSRIITSINSSTDSTVTKNYKFVDPPSTSSTTSTTSTSTPNPTPSAATVTPRQSIENVDIVNISASKAVIQITTSNKSTINLSYGTSPGVLNQKVNTLTPLAISEIKLDVLDPATIYYFRFTATDEDGNLVSSDIFTFKTAVLSNAPLIIPSSFIAASENTIISKSLGDKSLIVLPQNSNYEFNFVLEHDVSIVKAIAIVRSKSILGFHNLIAEASTQQTELIEVSSGVFSGRLKTSKIPGIYEVYARVHDSNGNISEQKIAEVHVIKKLKVVSKKTGEPIEGSRLLILLYNDRTRIYKVLPPTAISILNPSFTDILGESEIVLPQAKYIVQVSSIGYRDKNVEFTIDENTSQYPQIELESGNVGIPEILRHTQRSLIDVLLQSTAIYVENLTGSVRFFNVVARFILLSLIVLTLFAFFTKTKVPFTSIPSFILYYYHHLRGVHVKHKYFSGIVLDDKKRLVESAHIYLVDLITDQIVDQSKTDRIGHFFFRRNLDQAGVIVMKKGYKTSHLTSIGDGDEHEFEMTIEQIKDAKERLTTLPKKILKGILALSFETLLLFSLVLELLFLTSFGFAKTLPFLTLSFINLFIWLTYLRIRHHSLRS